MAKLEYSADAINSLSKFFRCDTIVYVEGDDDALFWMTVFERCAEVKIVTQALGGSRELDKFIERIVTEDLKVLAARDADFLTLFDQHRVDARVIHTYGYSIENTLYTDKAISRIAQLWCKGKGGVKDAHCREWLERFHLETEKLTEYDAANFLFNCGVSVTGDNIARFAKKTDPHEIDPPKVLRHLANTCKSISEGMLNNVLDSKALREENKIGRWIRGHFLASAVLQYVTHQIQGAGLATKVTYDGMYASAVEHLSNNLDNHHPHHSHYRESTTNALAAL